MFSTNFAELKIPVRVGGEWPPELQLLRTVREARGPICHRVTIAESTGLVVVPTVTLEPPSLQRFSSFIHVSHQSLRTIYIKELFSSFFRSQFSIWESIMRHLDLATRPS